MSTPAFGPGRREVVVEIRFDDRGEIMTEPLNFFVSKGGNEEVKWVCAQAHKHSEAGPCFTVDFESNGSPFYESQFSSDAPFSGLVRREVLPGPKLYKYTVRSGDKTSDPGGGVQK